MTKHLTRRSAVAGAAAFTTAMLRYLAGAAEFNYKLGEGEAPSHPVAVSLKATAEKIYRDTGGRLEIKTYPAYQLGNDSSMLLQIRSGALEFQLCTDANLSALVPICGISAVPFAFATYQDAWKTMDGPVGTYIANAIGKGGFEVFRQDWDSGFRQLSNRIRPMVKPEDLKGVKFRVPPSPVSVAAFRALGAELISVSVEQMYPSLQTHLVDGVEFSLIAFNDFKLYELLKYTTIWNYQHTSSHCVVNPDAWQRLPPNIRDIVEKNFHDSAISGRAEFLRLDNQLAAKLKNDGEVISQADIPAFKSVIRSAGLYAQLRDQYGVEPWTMLEKSVGRLA